MPKKLFVLAGEVSGDLHAAGVVAELLKARPDIRVFGIGGDKLRALGAELFYDTRRMSIMGFLEVLKHAGFLQRVIREMKELVRQEKPDLAFLVDYPGMNLLMARFFHEEGIPVIYYISPQVWAWKEGRVKAIGRYVDRLLVIFDFEVEFFRRHGIRAEFVGHPVIEELSEVSLSSENLFLKRHNILPGQRLIGLLPGSRRQEIALVLPEMLKAARMLAADYDAVFLLGRSPHMDEKHFSLVSEFGDIRIVECTAYEVMRYSELELVTSGTATLESLCFGVPMIVLYKTAWLNYAVGRLLVRLTSISLANIVTKGLGSKDQVVPELIQHKATASEIYMIARRLLDQPALLAEMRQELLDAREKLASASPSLIGSEILQEYL